MPINQPKIHTKILIYFRSGHISEFVVGFQVKHIERDIGFTDVDHRIHFLNHDAIEEIVVEHINGDTGE